MNTKKDTQAPASTVQAFAVFAPDGKIVNPITVDTGPRETWGSFGLRCNDRCDYVGDFIENAKRDGYTCRPVHISEAAPVRELGDEEIVKAYCRGAGVSMMAQTPEIFAGFRSVLAAATRPPGSDWVAVGERLPDVKAGDYTYLYVAIKRAHDGETYVMPCAYLNAKLLLSEDDDTDEEGTKPFTGWHQEYNDNAEYDNCFMPVETQGDIVTHWKPKPAPPSTVKEKSNG